MIITIDVRPHNVVSRRRFGDLPTTLLLLADSHLSEDLLLSANISVDINDNASSIAPFVNPANGQSEALVIENGELFYVCREPLSDSGFNCFGLGAGFPYIAPLNAAGGWAFADDGSIWQNITGKWSSPTSGPVPTQTATGTDGVIWGLVKGEAQTFDTSSLQWTDPPVPGNFGTPQGVDGLPSGSCETALWMAETGYFPQVWKYSNGGTQGLALSVTGYEQIQTMCVGFDGSVYALSNIGRLWMPFPKHVWQPWYPLNSPDNPFLSVAAISATQCWAITGSQGGPFGNLVSVAINPDKGELTLTEVDGPFQMQGGEITPSVVVGVDQTLWLTDSFGTVWKYLPTSAVPWQRQMMPPGVSGSTKGANVSDVVAMADAGGTIHAYYTTASGGLWHTYLSDGNWQPPTSVAISGSTAPLTFGPLCVAADPVGGAPLVYAVTFDGQLMVAGLSGATSGAVFGTAGQLDSQAPVAVALARLESGTVWTFCSVAKGSLVAAGFQFGTSFTLSAWQRFLVGQPSARSPSVHIRLPVGSSSFLIPAQTSGCCRI